ncbi:serine/threonine-protein kinase TBK1-like [Dermacentor variabilis]|uniref:serine/threonine-protein kinase TBK1-like n=1 Tax=Dermacentor variabilis TaxID=34621 RepID=UPI003F5B2F42
MSYLRGSANYVWNTRDVLGKGATGAVYRGVHKQTGEPVAVKTFNQVSQLRPLEVQMREFEVLKIVNHENIVRLLAVEEDVENHSKVLVMELCTGGSLFTILDDPANSYGLEEHDYLVVLRDLSAGMKHLRDNNIIHRDLKPGNIMKYVAEDGRFVYKLADFGAARELQDDQQFMSLYGTEEYLHPDMYERAVLKKSAGKSFGATVDLWSIGVTLYHVATGALPFRPYGGRRNKDTMYCITSKKESGVISGVQNAENGPIEWSKELPRTCLLSPGLREKVVPLLAGLLECDDSKMWTFEQFFESVTEVLRCRLVHVLYLNEGREIHAYLPSQATLADLKAEVYQQTNLPAASQLLLLPEGVLLESALGRGSSAHRLPPTTLEHPYLLLDINCAQVQVQPGAGAQTARFPAFASPASTLEHDASLAKTCCSVAHAMQRLLDKLCRCHGQLSKAPHALSCVLEEQTEKQLAKLNQAKTINNLLDQQLRILSVSHCNLCDLAELVQPQMQSNELQRLARTLTDKQESHAAITEQVSKLTADVAHLEQRILKGRSLRQQWESLCADVPNLEGCSETAMTYVQKIRESWQALAKDKAQRELSFHEKQFHILEKNKIRQTCQKLLSLLQERCLQACHKMAQALETWAKDALEIYGRSRHLDTELDSCLDMLASYGSAISKAGEVFQSTASSLVSDLKAQQQHSPTTTLPSTVTIASNTTMLSAGDLPSTNGAGPRKQRLPRQFTRGLQNLEICTAELLQLMDDNYAVTMKLFELPFPPQAAAGEDS